MDIKEKYISPESTVIRIYVDIPLMETSDSGIGIDDVSVYDDDEETIAPEEALSKYNSQPWEEFLSE